MNIPPIFPYSWASDWGEDQYGLWMGLNHKGVHCVFRWIDPGTFMMGSPEVEEGRYDNEDLHQVTLSEGLWIAETTVTQALWESVTGENPSHFKGENLPVEMINWNDCQAFIQTLNSFHSELEVRLPWESEWEYACRAGTDTPYNFGRSLSVKKLNSLASQRMELGKGWEEVESAKEILESQNDQRQAIQGTTLVKSYPCNEWGLYDMHGNVQEWCQDNWRASLGAESVTDPKCESTDPSDLRVIRGSFWRSSNRDIRSAYRNALSEGDLGSDIGLRLALDSSRQ